jgi:hypothetical protein
MIKSTYHEISWDDHGPVECTGPEFAYHPSRDAPSRLATQHLLGQVMIELHGDTAYTETYFISHNMNARHFYETIEDREIPDDSASNEVQHVTMLLGRYVDRLDKIDSEWRITVRKVVIEWGNEISGPFDRSVMARLHQSQRYPDDIIYHLSELRLPDHLLAKD